MLHLGNEKRLLPHEEVKICTKSRDTTRVMLCFSLYKIIIIIIQGSSLVRIESFSCLILTERFFLYGANGTEWFTGTEVVFFGMIRM